MGTLELHKEELSGMQDGIFQALFERSADAMLLLDGDRFVDCNPATLKMMCCTKEELVLLRPSQISPERQPDGRESLEKSEEMIRLAMARGSHVFEWVHRRPNGENFFAEVNLTPIPYGDRQVLLAVVRDFSIRKQIETALSQSEELYHTLFDSLQDGVFMIQGGSVHAVNPILAEMVGYTSSELEGVPFTEMVAPEDRAMVVDNYQKRMAGLPVSEEYVLRLLHKDGETRIAGNLRAYLISYHGKPGIMGTIHNVTETMQLATELRESQQHLQELLVRRGYQVQVITEVAQDISSAHALDDLFERVVTLVKDRFGYYHTQLLRYDPGQNAVQLVVGYGETGQRMKASGHRIEMGHGLIGVAAATGQTVLRPDVSIDSEWRPNPLLPATRGEIAVPIKYGDRILGVLDIQSDVTGALNDDDRLVLEGLCGQIAIAIEGTTLRQQMEERLTELNALYRATSREGWKTFHEAVELPSAFVFDRTNTRPEENLWLEEIGQAVQDTRLAPAASSSAAVAPLAVRGEVIGALGIYQDPDHPLSDLELDMIGQVSDQVALALESARLFEQTRLALGETEKQYTFTRSLAEAKDMQDLFDSTVDAFGVSDINRAVLFTFDIDDQDQLTGAQVKAAWYSGEGHLPFEVGTTFPADVARATFTRMRVETPQFYDDTDEDARSHGIFSAAVLPLWVGSRQIGAISLQATGRHVFTEEEKRIAPALGQQAAIAIESRLLLEGTIASEARFRSTSGQLTQALKISRMGYWELDLATMMFTFTDEIYAMLRTTAEAEGGYLIPVGQYAQKFVHPDDGHLVADETMKAIQTTDPNYTSQVEHRFFYADGEMGYVNVLIAVVKDEDGKTIGTRGANQDITERKRAEIAIEEQQRTLQAVLDNMPAGVLMVEAPSGKAMLSNRRAEEFLGRGISPNAAGDDLDQVYPSYIFGTDEIYPMAEMPSITAIHGEVKTISDLEVRKPDGQRVLLEVTGAPIYDTQGKIFASVAVFTDITERHRLEETVLQERAQLSEALLAARMAHWELDVTTGTFVFNDRFYDFLGTTAEAEGGYLMPAAVFAQKFVHPDDASIVAANMQNAIMTTDPNFRYDDMSRQVLANGDVRDVIVRFNIEKDAQGNTIRLYGANQDVTEQRRAEETIAKRAAELATVSRVSTTVATILSPDEMLQTVVDLTRSSFSLYHAHIYLLNDPGNALVLAKGAGEVGRKMVSEGRVIDLETEQSLVARAVRTRQGVIVNDVRQDPDFLPHALLPDTRSEMAVPLVVGDTVLGVMDIQSDEVNRFSQEDVSIMTTLAAQVAVSLQNARSYARAQRQAEREALINAISERIQSTNSVEAALQVAVRELGRALGAQHTAIRLGLERKNDGQ